MESYQVISSAKTSNLAAAILWASLLAGCSGNSMTMTTTTPPPMLQNASFAFVSNTTSATISAFELDPKTGMLFSVMGSPFPAGGAPEFMAADASGKFLFVANSGSDNISVFQIDGAAGMLTPAPGSPFPAGTQPEGVAVVSTANLLFVANNGSSNISVFKFNATSGALTQVPGSPFAGVPSPMGATTDVSGKFLYVTSPGANTVSAFTIDSSTGALAAVAGSPFATGSTPIGLTADPNGMFVYVADHMSDAATPADTISRFSVDPMSGALRPLGPLPVLQPNCSSSCHVNPLRVVAHPSGKFAYAANVGANTLSALSLQNGSLTAIASPVATGQHPFGVAFDPTGSFLYVVNKLDNNISAFSVNSATGMLSPLPGVPFAAGGNGPVGIVIVPSH
jgi:6-phosphogluconolactonase